MNASILLRASSKFGSISEDPLPRLRQTSVFCDREELCRVLPFESGTVLWSVIREYLVIVDDRIVCMAIDVRRLTRLCDWGSFL